MTTTSYVLKSCPAITGAMIALVAVATTMATSGRAHAQDAMAPTTDADAVIESEGLAIFRSAREALRDVKAITMRTAVSGDGSLGKAQMPTGSADVTLVRLATPTDKISFGVLARGEAINTPKSGDPRPIAVLRDAEGFGWIDHDQKSVYLGARSSSRMPEGIASLLMWAEETAALQPYGRELAATSYTVKDSETVDGVMCDVIDVTYAAPEETSRRGRGALSPAANATSATWHIAQTDRLPRRISRVQALEGMPLRLEFVQEFTKIEINPEGVTTDILTLETPEGYNLRDSRPNANAAIGTKSKEGKDARPSGPIGVNGQQSAGDGKTAMLDGVITDATEPVENAKPSRPMAPAFELVTASGDVVDLESLKGRVGVLYFWGTWCVPCRRVSPLMSDLADSFEGDAVSVYGVAVRERNAEAPAEYVAEKGYSYTLAMHPDDPKELRVANAFKVRRYPTVVVIGADGGIAGAEFLNSDVNPEELASRVKSYVEAELSAMQGG